MLRSLLHQRVGPSRVLLERFRTESFQSSGVPCTVLRMTLVIPAGYAHVVHSLLWTGDPEPMAVTYGVKLTAAGVDAPDTIAGDLAAAFVAQPLTNMNSLLTLVSTEAKINVVETEPEAYELGISTTGGAGGEAATCLPQNSAYLVHKRTGVGGRIGRGRMYIPGVHEAAADNLGNVSSGEIGEWNTKLTAWLAAIVAKPTIDYMCLLHDSEGIGAALLPYQVTALTLDPLIATQRRRLRK